MATFVKAESDEGAVLFEVDEITTLRTERVTRDGKNVFAKLDERLDAALASVRPAAESIHDALADLNPGEVKVEFGLKVDAEAGAVIAKTGIEGHFTVSLTWTHA